MNTFLYVCIIISAFNLFFNLSLTLFSIFFGSKFSIFSKKMAEESKSRHNCWNGSNLFHNAYYVCLDYLFLL